MTDPRAADLLRRALGRPATRRGLLRAGLRLGAAAPAAALLGSARGLAAPNPTVGPRALLSADKGTLTVILLGDIDDLDPQYAYSSYASMVFFGAYEMLIQYKGTATDQYAPMLAESWSANADNSSYTFKLSPKAVFHDGTPCDATAVKASYTRYFQMDAAVANVLKRFVTDPEMMVVVDPQTLRFDLGRPQPSFLAAMASQYGPFVVNPKLIDQNKSAEDPYAHEWFRVNVEPGGTGPYTLQEYSTGERLVLKKFDGYHGGWKGTEFDQIVVRIVPENGTRRQLMEKGEADATTFNLTPDDVKALQANPKLTVDIYDTTRVNWVIMNVPKLKTVDARKGFSYAFPYDDVIRTAYKGLIKRSGPLPDTVRAYDPNVFLYKTDLAKAKQLITSAGFKDGDSFTYIYTSGDEVERTVAQLFQANLAQIGFTLNVSEMTTDALNTLVYSNQDPSEPDIPHFVGGWAWWPDYNDPWSQFYPNFTKAATRGGGSNMGGWVNQRFEDIMAQAKEFTSEQQLDQLMKEAQNILTEQDPPVIYEGQVKYYTILQKDIQGFYGNPLYLDTYPFYNMSRAGS